MRVTSENVAELLDADFVFLAMDSGPDKKTIIEVLTAAGVPFIDTGIGVSNDPKVSPGSPRHDFHARPHRAHRARRSDLVLRRG